MPRIAPIQTNFTVGELSPRLRARTNWEKYPNAVEELTNYIVQPHGPAVKRPGLRFIQEIKDSTQNAWLVPFEFSPTQVYVLEFGHQYIRFYWEMGCVLDAYSNIYEISTDYNYRRASATIACWMTCVTIKQSTCLYLQRLLARPHI